jgi:hypothetical protein
MDFLSDERFLELIGERFKDSPEKLARPDQSEKDIAIEIASLLLDRGLKAFLEYPYAPYGKEGYTDNCDLVITEKDCRKITHWIEIKPIWEKEFCIYWTPSKFFGAASPSSPFMRDVEKLDSLRKRRNSKSEKFWFLVLLVTDQQLSEKNSEDPVQGVSLRPSQIIKAIDIWSNQSRRFMKVIKYGDKNCHILLWNIEGYQKRLFEPVNKKYRLD